MSTAPAAAPGAIAHLLATGQEYPSPTVVAQAVLQKDIRAEYRRSIEDPEGFWGDQAAAFAWSRKWDRVFDWDGVHHQWFVGGKTNITVNALDRHADSERRNRAAYVWLGEGGAERVVPRGACYFLSSSPLSLRMFSK